MNRIILAVVFACAAAAVPAVAQVPQVYGTPSPTAATYNDPAMSYTAPPGYVKAQLPPHDPKTFEQPAIVAAFMHSGKNVAPMTITIEMQNFQGPLDGFEAQSENEVRTQTDSAFFKKSATTLSNGMPAYWQEITMGSGFQELKRYQYVWVDGIRGIELAITAREGDLGEDEAKRALASATGVAYPLNRY
jgi:hypothetical protein